MSKNRYDEMPRVDRSVANGHQPSMGAKKKNTKRWCKGKVGREHVWGEPYDPYPHLTRFWRSWLRKDCINCGKQEHVRSKP